MDSLTTDYLKDVIGKMEVYGYRVQFGFTRPGPRPHYQVTNTAEKKMAFDSNHHLLHPKEDEFVGVNSTPLFSLEKIKAAVAAGGFRSTTSRSTRSSGSSGATRGGKSQGFDRCGEVRVFQGNTAICCLKVLADTQLKLPN